MSNTNASERIDHGWSSRQLTPQSFVPNRHTKPRRLASHQRKTENIDFRNSDSNGSVSADRRSRSPKRDYKIYASNQNIPLPPRPRIDAYRPTCRNERYYYTDGKLDSEAVVSRRSHPRPASRRSHRATKRSSEHLSLQRRDRMSPRQGLPSNDLSDRGSGPVDDPHKAMPKNFDKPLTCFYWYNLGRCKKSDLDCWYAHWDTGNIAQAPVKLTNNPQDRAIAGVAVAAATRIHDVNGNDEQTPTISYMSQEAQADNMNQDSHSGKIFSIEATSKRVIGNVPPSMKDDISERNGSQAQSAAEKLHEAFAQARVLTDNTLCSLRSDQERLSNALPIDNDEIAAGLSLVTTGRASLLSSTQSMIETLNIFHQKLEEIGELTIVPAEEPEGE